LPHSAQTKINNQARETKAPNIATDTLQQHDDSVRLRNKFFIASILPFREELIGNRQEQLTDGKNQKTCPVPGLSPKLSREDRDPKL